MVHRCIIAFVSALLPKAPGGFVPIVRSVVGGHLARFLNPKPQTLNPKPQTLNPKP